VEAYVNVRDGGGRQHSALARKEGVNSSKGRQTLETSRELRKIERKREFGAKKDAGSCWKLRPGKKSTGVFPPVKS